MNYYITRGNTWLPVLEITDNGEPMDCSDYNCKLWIKETLKETAPEIQEISITWTDQSGGVGYFNITETMSDNLLGRYWIEVILYKTDYSIIETLIKTRLIVRETLEKDL